MLALYRCVFMALMISVQFLALTACANEDTIFVPPAERPQNNSDNDWPLNHVLALAYHEVEDRDPDQTFVSVRTDHLVDHLAWLRENDYKPVSIDQILDASQGKTTLPAK